MGIKIIYDDQERSKKYYFPYGADLKVIQIGTSMNENLTQFTPYTFKNLKYYRLNAIKGINVSEEYKIMKYYKRKIMEYQPDILIFCITPMNLEKSNQWFEEK